MSNQTGLTVPLTLPSLQKSYQQGTVTPVDVIKSILADLALRGDDGIWIYTLPEQTLIERATTLMQMSAS